MAVAALLFPATPTDNVNTTVVTNTANSNTNAATNRVSNTNAATNAASNSNTTVQGQIVLDFG